MPNVSNYKEQGGGSWVVGDEIEVSGTLNVSGTIQNDGSDAVLIEEQDAIADLDQDISATYVEAEVQAISDKVDAVLAALRAAGLLATS